MTHGQHLRQTEEFSCSKSWQWLKRGSLKRETESLLVAAQDQALPTNYRKTKIENNLSHPCVWCDNRTEGTVTHLVSEWSKRVRSKYKGRHDRVATAVHWWLAKKYGLQHTEKWYVEIGADSRSWTEEEEKVKKYSELAWELKRIWGVKTRVMPIVIGALGTVTKRHQRFFTVLGADLSFEPIQKASFYFKEGRRS